MRLDSFFFFPLLIGEQMRSVSLYNCIDDKQDGARLRRSDDSVKYIALFRCKC